jgi:putative flippase GtrA
MATSKWAQYWRRYIVYVIVATVVGGITIAIREVLAYLLGDDTKFNYALSVLIAYACGIVLSFFWQGRVTFRQHRVAQLRSRFSVFAVMAVASSILTVTISRLLRYEGGFDHLFGVAGPGLAFGLAGVLTSVIAYAVNARFVFDRETPAVTLRK